MGTGDDFRSLDRRVINQQDILGLMGEALSYQHMFSRRTTLYEIAEWKKDDLDHFTIDANKMDRVYYIKNYSVPGGEKLYTLLARMQYGSRKAYFILSANREFQGLGRVVSQG